jgi:hypothetical protein
MSFPSPRQTFDGCIRIEGILLHPPPGMSSDALGIVHDCGHGSVGEELMKAIDERWPAGR